MRAVKLSAKVLLYPYLFLLAVTAAAAGDNFRINAGTVALDNSSSLDVGGSLGIGAGGALSASGTGGVTISVSGSWEGTGVFSAGDSDVIFYGTGVSTISGNNTFYDVGCTQAGKELHFAGGSTQTVGGTATLTGAEGSFIKLRSASGTQKWYIRFPGGVQGAAYVDVKDASASENPIICSTSLDSGNNNEYWVFKDTTPPAAITVLSASSYSASGEVLLSWTSPGDDVWSGELGTPVDKAQFRIQYETYTAVAWSTGTYDISIDTYAVVPYDSISAVTKLVQETFYYFRIWARDGEASGNWSGLSGGATAWCRIRPGDITDLSSAAEDDGSVTLSWTAPGDDGTSGQIAGGRYRIRWSTVSGTDFNVGTWEDYDDKYSLEFSTDIVPQDTHSFSVTGLHGGKQYYFRVWTRDEDAGANSPGNWSGISSGSTVTVTEVISISVSTDSYNFGGISINSSTTTLTSVDVLNSGNVTQNYSMLIDTITLSDSTSSLWRSTDTSVGHDRFILYGVFHGAQAAPANFDYPNDIIGTVSAACSDTVFSDDDGGGAKQAGSGVPKGETRNLWFRLDMPESITKGGEEKISIRIDSAKE
ncbi:MAG: fibronectin type III domain-containing protein [Elusimicrobia bacterium]|nr:fibronectin type III domain-containing protein [Elusimicrobiota bacterium]